MWIQFILQETIRTRSLHAEIGEDLTARQRVQYPEKPKANGKCALEAAQGQNLESQSGYQVQGQARGQKQETNPKRLEQGRYLSTDETGNKGQR